MDSGESSGCDEWASPTYGSWFGGHAGQLPTLDRLMVVGQMINFSPAAQRETNQNTK